LEQAELVAGGVGCGGGGTANDFSTTNNPNNPVKINAEHIPIIFFILSDFLKLISCHTKKQEWKPPIVSRN